MGMQCNIKMKKQGDQIVEKMNIALNIDNYNHDGVLSDR